MICPQCKQDTGVKVVYGMPAELETWNAADRKEIILGGCCISNGQPTRGCTSCGHRWDNLRVDGLKYTAGFGKPPSIRLSENA